MDTLPSGCLPAVHQLSSFLGCLRRFQLRARLGSRLSAHPGQRGITPAFGYSAPYPSASGTPTHLIWALPSTQYGPLRHPARPDLPLYGVPVGACTPPPGLPVLLRLPSPIHADTTTPAGPARCLCRFSPRPVVGLPLISGGSAPASPFSRPARCSRMFRPAWLLNCSSQPFDTGVLQSLLLPP